MRRGSGCGGGAGRGRDDSMGNGSGRGRGNGRGSCTVMRAARQMAAGLFSSDVKVASRPVRAHVNSGVVRVDASRCTGCGICIDVCPEQAISIQRVAVVNPRLCTTCGACVRQCPQGALTLSSPVIHV
jgi:ferredoxin